MEVDRISYIFGSFSRRRQSRDISSVKRRSIEPPKIFHDRSNSAPHTTKKSESTPQRTKSVCNVTNIDQSKFKCLVCQKIFVEPRVLPCLHTFCTKCIEELDISTSNPSNIESTVSLHEKTETSEESGQGSSSAGSGCAGDKQKQLEENLSAPLKHKKRKAILCPTCGVRAELPAQGVSSFPLNYLLQHRLVLATLSASGVKLLCDLCTSDIKATSRCTECAISLCEHCSETHSRQRNSIDHQVLTIEESRRRGMTRVRRQIMCAIHAERELTIFCSTCFQVICRDCISTSHRGHLCETASKAAKRFTDSIRSAIENVKITAEQSSITLARLHSTAQHIEIQCNQVQAEVEKFIETYIQAVEEHRKNLHQQINETKRENLEVLEKQKKELQEQAKDAKNVANFVDELLREGADVEVLTFAGPVSKKLNYYAVYKVPELKISNSLQFLPKEIVSDTSGGCPLYGVVTKQTVSPKNCHLSTQGLQNLRVGKKAEILLEARDKNNLCLGRGGEQISAEVLHKDPGIPRTLPAHVEDKKNGTYLIWFVPDVAGKLLLNINVKGVPIKNSPFPLVVRTVKPHQGTFHCCSFCSTSGSKEAICGCGGKMPGGYKGCGHGHEGHPGRRHWSCCGNVLEHSECSRTNSTTHYQFTL